ncbi:hypothetical protein [Streptomyces nondiastaticus]|uniref:SMI1/KNR4 family protein n=1 Tax=Streptomyces nondiastaticus TaxID=3154512 RepID=A0ABW6U6S1_9ACTN
MSDLPHDTCMEVVAQALAAYEIEPRDWWTEADNEELSATFQGWPDGMVTESAWPHGVFLTRDPDRGWLLVKAGGSRTVHKLPDVSLIYCDSWQVAADTVARLGHGMDEWEPGPICMDGSHWGTRATHDAVTLWLATAA